MNARDAHLEMHEMHISHNRRYTSRADLPYRLKQRSEEVICGRAGLLRTEGFRLTLFCDAGIGNFREAAVFTCRKGSYKLLIICQK